MKNKKLTVEKAQFPKSTRLLRSYLLARRSGFNAMLVQPFHPCATCNAFGNLRSGSLPHSLRDSAALFLAVGGEAADQVGGVQSAAEDAAHCAEQQQLTVVRRRRAQSSTNLFHDLTNEKRDGFFITLKKKVLLYFPTISFMFFFFYNIQK